MFFDMDLSFTDPALTASPDRDYVVPPRRSAESSGFESQAEPPVSVAAVMPDCVADTILYYENKNPTSEVALLASVQPTPVWWHC